MIHNSDENLETKKTVEKSGEAKSTALKLEYDVDMLTNQINKCGSQLQMKNEKQMLLMNKRISQVR